MEGTLLNHTNKSLGIKSAVAEQVFLSMPPRNRKLRKTAAITDEAWQEWANDGM